MTLQTLSCVCLLFLFISTWSSGWNRMCLVIIPYEAVSSLWKQYWTQVFLFSFNTCFELTFLWFKLPSRFKYRVRTKDFCLLCVVLLKWRPELDLILLYQNLKNLRISEIFVLKCVFWLLFYKIQKVHSIWNHFVRYYKDFHSYRAQLSTWNWDLQLVNH